MAVNWTDAQYDAIHARGGDLLVSASAGSGKTAVLTERVLTLLTDPTAPVDLDRMLIVTFTRAAAAEMRGRISEKLALLAEEYPQDARIIRQQLLLDSAQISTIHSFCITLVRDHFSKLDLPADLRVADEMEMEVLRARAIGELLDGCYAQPTPGFVALLELMTVAGGEDALAGMIQKLYDFVRNHPFYRDLLTGMAAEYSAQIPLEQTSWCAVLLDYARETLEHARNLTALSIALAEGDEKMEKAYLPALLSDRRQLDVCLETLEQGDWDRLAHTVSGISFDSFSALRGASPEKEQIKKYRELAKKSVGILKNDLFIMTREEHAAAMAQTAPAVQELFALVERFDDALAQEKKQRAVMDFSDLEHHTLRLLYDGGAAAHTPSALSREIASGYDAVLLDEYQDVNEIQEMIFQALKAGGAALFMVGDVKQSIYRFREARPDIFLEKKKNFALYSRANPRFPAKIPLGANFRTRPEITGFVNYVFGAVMSDAVGGMRYTAEDALLPGRAWDGAGEPVSLCVIAAEKTQETPDPEARYIAGEIRRLLDSGYAITEDGVRRQVRPGDICILLRAARNRAESLLSELARVGVAGWSERQSSILETPETACIIFFLKLLANPMLDIELAAVLASPMYALSSEELAQLRLAAGSGRLFPALDDAGVPGCARFVQDYRKLRFLAASATAGRMVRAVCDATALTQKARAMPDSGAQTNIHLLMEYADEYERRGDVTLSGFVDYLYALEEYGYDLAAASSARRDAVSILTVHKSKGLEFPIVFVAGCASKFNTADSRALTAFSQKLGFGCALQDPARMQKRKTLPYLAINIDNARGDLSEELCILYVAMTRAREKLYLTACDPGAVKLSACCDVPFADGKMDCASAARARCVYDWIAPVAARRADFDDTLLSRLPERLPFAEGSMEVRVISDPEAEPVGQQQTVAQAAPVDQAALERLSAVLAYDYPYASDIVTPEKLAVSDIAETATRAQHLFSRRPKFMTRKTLTPAERGVAAHKYMQFAAFAAAAKDPAAELARLVSGGFLEPQEAEALDLAMIERFFAGSLGQRALRADKVYRELRFLRECTPQELTAVDPALHIAAATVLQGVADCVILEGGRGTVIDYKTDALAQPLEFVTRYAAQLRLYQFILRETLALPVEEMKLYSFYLGCEILVSPLTAP